MNNLYGWAMSGYLPCGGFKWLKNVDNFDANSINENSPIGYIFEVDLEYHKELHVLYNDYSLAPENLQFRIICCQVIMKKLQTNMG